MAGKNNEDKSVDDRKLLKMMQGKVLLTGVTWLRTEISGGLLRTLQQILMFRKRQGVSWLSERLSAPQERLCSMQSAPDTGQVLTARYVSKII